MFINFVFLVTALIENMAVNSMFKKLQVLSECGDYDKAEMYFKKAGELDPKDPNVYVHRG